MIHTDAILYLRHEYLHDYLRFLFDSEGKPEIEIGRGHKLGSYICCIRKYSDMPKETKAPRGFEYEVRLTFPSNRTKSKFIYFVQEDIMDINDMVEAYFDIDFWRYYLHGQKMSIPQKDILETFIISRKLNSLAYNTEVLKKREYREELRNMEKGIWVLRKKAQYVNEQVKVQLKEYCNNLLMTDNKKLYVNSQN